MQVDRSKPARVGCVLHSTPALTSASSPKGVLSTLPPAPRGNIQERVRAASVLPFASLSVGFWGPPELGVMFRIEPGPLPSHHNEHPQLPGQIEHGSKTMDFKGLFGVGGVNRKSRAWTSFEALGGGAP